MEDAVDRRITQEKYGSSIVERLLELGILGENSIAAHAIHLQEEEKDILGGSGVIVAHNPQSNMNNAVGLPDFKLLKDTGVRCLIGNDGMSAGMMGEWTSLYYAMKHRYSSPSAFGLDDLLEVIDNNYSYINKTTGSRIGRIEKGYDADLLSVEYEPPTPMEAAHFKPAGLPRR